MIGWVVYASKPEVDRKRKFKEEWRVRFNLMIITLVWINKVRIVAAPLVYVIDSYGFKVIGSMKNLGSVLTVACRFKTLVCISYWL